MLTISQWLKEKNFEKPLRAGRACPLLLVAGFGRISPTRFRTRAVGQTGSRTVAQTHEKRAHETVKGGPVTP